MAFYLRNLAITCLLAVPCMTGVALAVTVDDILKLKQSFESAEALQITKEYKEVFDRFNGPLAKFDDLYANMVDAESGRNPWKITEQPSLLDDPLKRIIYDQNIGYEAVAKSLNGVLLPLDMFSLESSGAQYLQDFRACDLKAAQALTDDIGKINILLPMLSNVENSLTATAKQESDVVAIWNNPILTFLDALRYAPRVGEFDVSSYAFMTGQTIRGTILGTLGGTLGHSGSLNDVEDAVAGRLKVVTNDEKTLTEYRTALSSALTKFQSTCASPTPPLVITEPGPPIPAVSLPQPDLSHDATFRFHNLDSHTVIIEFFGSGRIVGTYTLAPQQRLVQSASCNPGEKVCYGAWRNDQESVWWGVGQNNHTCSVNCCVTCGAIEDFALDAPPPPTPARTPPQPVPAPPPPFTPPPPAGDGGPGCLLGQC